MISLAQLESIGEDVWSAFTTAHNLVMQDAVTVYIDLRRRQTYYYNIICYSRH